MADTPRTPKEKKPGFFDSISKAIDDVKQEVKADLAAMTPPEPKVDAKKEAAKVEANSKLLGIVGQASHGVAEEIVGGDEPVPTLEPDEDPSRPETRKPVPLTMPVGNMWENMGSPTLGNRFAGDVCYHAPTVPDVESYKKALDAEAVAPFTIGIVAVGLQGHMRDDGDEVGDDLLFLALQKAMAEQSRLYGAVGAGPRQIWDDLDLLDETLTAHLNESPKMIALGPVGLDAPFAPYAVKAQQAQLAVQLDIAADFDLPVLLTQRQSLAELVEVLAGVERLPRLIYMDVIESADVLDVVNRFGMSVVVRPELTQPGFAGAGLYRQVPVERLLLGSGSALVAPHGFSGHFNKPAFLQNTLTAAAQLLGRKEADVRLQVNANMVAMFYRA